jgi:hypothetical protein
MKGYHRQSMSIIMTSWPAGEDVGSVVVGAGSGMDGA